MTTLVKHGSSITGNSLVVRQLSVVNLDSLLLRPPHNRSVQIRVRKNEQLITARLLLPGANCKLDFDPPLLLTTGDRINVSCETSANLGCRWECCTQEADSVAIEAAADSVAARLYPLEQSAVQERVEQMFAEWDAVGTLAANPELDAAEAEAGPPPPVPAVFATRFPDEQVAPRRGGADERRRRRTTSSSDC